MPKAEPVATRARRRGMPRDMTGLSAGNPFASDTRRGTAFDDTPAGYTDMRRNVPPAYEMKVPHRVAIWPEGSPIGIRL